MAIVTLNEVKAVLNTTGSTAYDARISTFIPYVQEDILEYTGNDFADGYVSQEGALTIATSTGRGDKITDPNSKFLAAGFAPGMDIAIEGGYSNVGIWTIGSSSGSVTAANIFLASSSQVIPQDRTDEVNVAGTITVSRVKWPLSLKPIAAKMVWHLIDKPKDAGAQSESLGDYSITYAGSNAYPETVLRGLEKWRKVRML